MKKDWKLLFPPVVRPSSLCVPFLEPLTWASLTQKSPEVGELRTVYAAGRLRQGIVDAVEVTHRLVRRYVPSAEWDPSQSLI